jgi:hypothetical protein
MDANKYTEAVRLLNHCQGVEDNVELHRRLDSFFAHLLDNFPVPDATDPAQLDAMLALLRGSVSELEVAVREIPPGIADELYPVALMRVALLVYRIPLQPTMSKTFDQFHKTYGKFIKDASNRDRPRYAIDPKAAEEAQDEIAASTGRTDLFKEWKDNSPAAADLKQKLAAVKNSQDS